MSSPELAPVELPTSQPHLLELSGPRLVSFLVHSRPVTYRFHPIESKDWLRFFAGIVIMSEADDAARTDVIDIKTPGLTLVEDKLEAVIGYQAEDEQRQPTDLMQLPNWKSRLPYGHKLRAAELLQECGWQDSSDASLILADYDQIVLDCLWGSEEPGSMTAFSGLVHKFRPATARQQQRMARASSEAKVINMGKGRAGRTIYPGRHEMLLDTYDELIVAVDGYSFNGNPLTTDRGVIISAMDGYHKVTAVQKLFAPVR